MNIKIKFGCCATLNGILLTIICTFCIAVYKRCGEWRFPNCLGISPSIARSAAKFIFFIRSHSLCWQPFYSGLLHMNRDINTLCLCLMCTFYACYKNNIKQMFRNKWQNNSKIIIKRRLRTTTGASDGKARRKRKKRKICAEQYVAKSMRYRYGARICGKVFFRYAYVLYINNNNNQIKRRKEGTWERAQNPFLATLVRWRW